MADTLVDVAGRLDARRKEVFEFVEAKQALGFTDADLDQIQTWKKEMAALADQEARLREADSLATEARKAHQIYSTPAPQIGHAAPGADPAQTSERKTLGEIVALGVKAAGFRTGMTQFQTDLAGVQLKTTITTAAGFAPPNDRGPVIVPYALRRPMIQDLIPTDPIGTGWNAVTYMEETTNTNNAAARSEGTTATDSAFVWTARTVTIEIVSAAVPVTDQQLDDVAQMQALINNRLTLQLQLKFEDLLLNGTGTSPQIQGILTKSGILTQAQGADPSESAAYKALTKVRHTGFASPSAFVFHPNDWQDMRLHQDANGNYVWGPPSAPDPDRLWGLPVIPTTAMTENTGLTGDFRSFAHITERQGITVAITNSHASEFLSGIQHIRLDYRASLELYRAAAFATITGLTA